MHRSSTARLIDVVEVDYRDRVRCQAKGCGHGVYARIHVVLDGGNFVVLGSDCFQRLYGGVLTGTKSHYGGSNNNPRHLDEEMRALLTENTAAFVRRLEGIRQEFEAEVARRQALERQQIALREMQFKAKAELLAAERMRKAPRPVSFNNATAGQFRYMWSSSWWSSSDKVRADVQSVLDEPEYVQVICEAINLLTRQPSYTPVEFALRLSEQSVPSEVTLECLTQIRLAVRSKKS